MQCPECASQEIEVNDAGGDAVCVRCGTVVEENAIVSSIEFEETGGVRGQFMSATAQKPYSSSVRGRGRYSYARDSRDTTLANGRKQIGQVASSLRLSAHFTENAHRLFTIAVQRSFVQGRKTMQVVAACLYIVCRQERSPHLLIDFSDALQINVFKLGATFMKFKKLLNLKLPIVDPGLYIHRFAAKLNFGKKESDVCVTALRLLKSMKRNWIEVGRRPLGLCAAALLMGARMNDCDVDMEDLLKTFPVSQGTILLRMREFEQTPAAQLTIEQFQRGDDQHLLEYEPMDPPAFIESEARRQDPLLTEGKEMKALPPAEGDEVVEAGETSTAIVVAQGKSHSPRRSRRRDQAMKKMYSELEKDLDSKLDTAKDESVQDTEEGTEEESGAIVSVSESNGALIPVEDDGLEDKLSDLDDDEMDKMILSSAEAKKKEAIWVMMNQEYLQAQAEREQREKLEQEAGVSTEQRRISRKIDYSKLDGSLASGADGSKNMKKALDKSAAAAAAAAAAAKLKEENGASSWSDAYLGKRRRIRVAAEKGDESKKVAKSSGQSKPSTSKMKDGISPSLAEKAARAAAAATVRGLGLGMTPSNNNIIRPVSTETSSTLREKDQAPPADKDTEEQDTEEHDEEEAPADVDLQHEPYGDYGEYDNYGDEYGDEYF